MSWYESLDETTREKLFSEMRELGTESERLWAEHEKLSPPSGSIAVGGAHMDSLFRACAVDGLLRSLRQGETLEAAEEAACVASADAVKRWNARREYQVHRSTEVDVAYVRGLVARLRRSLSVEFEEVPNGEK